MDMTGVQFGRKLSLQILDAESNEQIADLSGLRVQFHVTQSHNLTPNTLQARVFNLSRGTAKLIGLGLTREAIADDITRQLRIKLSAGYEHAQYGLIFDGNIWQTRFGRIDQTDTYYDIVAATGDNMLTYQFVCTGQLRPMSTQDIVREVVKAAKDQFGTTVEIVGEDVLDGKKPARANVIVGTLPQVLEQLGKAKGLIFSFQDGRMVATDRSGATADAEANAVTLNSRSGLIGMPEQTQAGISIKCLLNPGLKPTGAVRVDQDSIQRFALGTTNQDLVNFHSNVPPVTSDNLYTIYVAEHQGDTRGSPWYTNLICTAFGTGPSLPLIAKGQGA